MTIDQQMKYFREGFPWMKIVAPATPEKGIKVLDGKQQDEAIRYADEADVAGKVKFVPASGAASRMFKDIFAGLDSPNDATRKLTAEISRFAFWRDMARRLFAQAFRAKNGGSFRECYAERKEICGRLRARQKGLQPKRHGREQVAFLC